MLVVFLVTVMCGFSGSVGSSVLPGSSGSTGSSSSGSSGSPGSVPFAVASLTTFVALISDSSTTYSKV